MYQPMQLNFTKTKNYKKQLKKRSLKLSHKSPKNKMEKLQKKTKFKSLSKIE